VLEEGSFKKLVVKIMCTIHNIEQMFHKKARKMTILSKSGHETANKHQKRSCCGGGHDS